MNELEDSSRFASLYAGLDRLVSRMPGFVWLADLELRYESVLGSRFLANSDIGVHWRGRSAVDFPADGNPTHPFVLASERARAGEAAECDFSFRGRLYRACLEPRLDDDGAIVGILGVAYDVTDRRRVTELLSREVRFDELTRLPNRLVFAERLAVAAQEARRDGTRFAVLFVDIDRFKSVNEALGQGIGDRLLQAAADRIGLRAGEDALVARYGGDQFVVLVGITHASEATRLCEAIVETFEPPIVVRAREIFATVSVGLAIAPDDGLEPDRVVGNAGTALHDAKDLGGNGYRRYDSRRRDHASDRFAIETDLRRTVGADDGPLADLAREGFILHYQPIVNASDERIVGAEALIRWNHPLRKLVPPDAFIPLAEQTGLIHKIGEWVLRTAMLQVCAWDRVGLHVGRLSVNISGRQFHHGNLVEMVERILTQTGLAPDRVELELTETVVMRDVEATILTLGRLKALGVYLSVDDFGTGYSSLSYLKRFPIDTLKIDRSFTRDASNGPDDAAIVRTIVALGHSLRKRVVAEGVETRGQIEFLREIECDELQGYYFGRPVPPTEFGVLLRGPLRPIPVRARRRVRAFPGDRLPLA